MSDLPYHIVVGMPALSPTMEAGTLAAWNVKEGDSFIAGDSLAKIDTDKASIDFEAQDDGYVAKLLVNEGTEDVVCGSPIMVTVEEADDVAAFANFVAEETAPVATKEEPPTAAAVAAPPPPPVAAAAPPTPPPAVKTPAVAESFPGATSRSTALAKSGDPSAGKRIDELAADAGVPTMGPAWGNLAQTNSPLAATLSAQQKNYVEKYGTTGQVPL
jgi:pyruvate dehydrogenase E2 component (dihydrolipoamide acetyltransferase)